jgi:hypothetical protein
MNTAATSQRRRVADEAAARDYAYEQGWTDGLPTVAATPERVAAFLEHAGLDPDHPVAHYEVRNRSIPAEKVAISAVMAGCKPEHFPVVVAAIEAVTDHAFHLNHIASTSSPYPFFVVNGPVVGALGLHSGASVLGPGHAPNALIARAISLTLANCLEARIGGVQQGVLGTPARMIGVIAEKPDSGWEPLSVLRGVAAGSSAVTAIPQFMGGPQEIWAHPAEAFPSATALASFIGEHFNEYNSAGIGGTHLVLVSPSMQRRFLTDGWSKAALREWLRENARVSLAKLMMRPGPGGIWPKGAAEAPNGALAPSEADYGKYWYLGRLEKNDALYENDPRNSRDMTKRPSDFEIVVAGAEEGPMIAALGRCYPLLPEAATKVIRSPLSA